MLAFKSTFLYKSIWRIRLTEETRSVFEVGSEQLCDPPEVHKSRPQSPMIKYDRKVPHEKNKSCQMAADGSCDICLLERLYIF